MVLPINPGPYKPQDTNMEITPYTINAAVEMYFELPVCGACSTDPTSQINNMNLAYSTLCNN
jgi:hypothetical protein